MPINNVNHKPKNGVNHNRHGWIFLKEFFKHPLQIGSIVPSSRYLEKAVLQSAKAESASTIVELGCGTGGTTRAILKAMTPQATLLSIEINPCFHSMLSKIEDKRLIAHLGSAEQLNDIVNSYGLKAPDAVISGIPFSTMTDAVGERIIREVENMLAPNARFVAYQVSGRVAQLCRPHMGTEKAVLEIRNIPPMRIYHWEKRA
ncbi:MAG: methyltransferase type 12 [Gammaproteobacteria bacterium]|jgi:phospholipid N-methyltransferase